MTAKSGADHLHSWDDGGDESAFLFNFSQSQSSGPDPAGPGPVLVPDETIEANSANNGPGGPGSEVAVVSGGITINLEFDAAAMAAPASFRAGIQQAAAILAASISDPITVNIAIDYSGTGGGAAGGPEGGLYINYSTVRAALTGNATAGDKTFNVLPTGTTFAGQPYVAVWDAQLKLWGLSMPSDYTGVDGSATFARDINPNLLVGVALHELTHAIGRVPYGVSSNSSYSSPYPDIFDFFRYTSSGQPLIDGDSTAPAAYFSLDGGNTRLAAYGQTSDSSDFLNSGIQGSNDSFNEFYSSSTLQSLTGVDLKQLDALGYHINPSLNTTVEAAGTASLVELANNYFLTNITTGLGPELKFGGSLVVAGQFSASGSVWVPIGVETTATGYEIAWKLGNTSTYSVWATDGGGNYTSNLYMPGPGNTAALEQLETSFHQDLNGDGVLGVPDNAIHTNTNSFGSTSLVETGNNYILKNPSSGLGPELSFGGAPVTDGEFMASGSTWAPVGAALTATGYEVAWKLGSTNTYSVWATDSNGNYTSNLYLPGPGNSPALEQLETSFNQDLNGDGTIGLNVTVIHTDTNSFGSTSLVASGNNYFLVNPGNELGPELSFGGALVTTGEFVVNGSTWTPIGAALTASGYEVAWKLGATSTYSVWATDSSGNYTSNFYLPGPGNAAALEQLETSFVQDLNGDGTIGVVPTVIHTDTNSFGSTSLVEIGSNYFLKNPISGLGPELNFGGAPVTDGQFVVNGSTWTPIGAALTASGYEVAWKLGATSTYSVWATDSNGNYTSNFYMPGPGNNAALEQLETSFNQDLNGDGTIGVVPGVAPAPAAASTVPPVTMSVGGDNFHFGLDKAIGNPGTTGSTGLQDLFSGHPGLFHDQPPPGPTQTAPTFLADDGHPANFNLVHDNIVQLDAHLLNLHWVVH